MLDSVCLGEILIDMTPVDSHDGRVYEPNPGGAPANVAITLARMGKKVGFIGTVGNDFFGELLRHTLESSNITTECLSTTKKAPTTFAFVHLDNNGERSFSFYRHPGADMFLQWTAKEKNLIQKAKILHCGSLSMTTPQLASITRKVFYYARKHKKIISFDPNIRLSLWQTPSFARKTILSVLSLVSILKVSEEELLFLSQKQNINEGLQWISRFSIPLVVITRGKDGVIAQTPQGQFYCSSFDVPVVDTTGAGDAFVGGLLAKLSEFENSLSLSQQELLSVLQFASAVAAITVSRRGAIPAIPSRSEVEHFLTSYQR